MRLKKVVAENPLGKKMVRFASSSSGVRELKREMTELGFLRKQIEDEDVEVESGKAGLLAFLNGLMEEHDLEAGEDE